MHKAAEISKDGKHRLSLLRRWDESLPVLGWIMLNPSTADASIDDPTIKKCMGFAKRWGYGSIQVGNLFTLRTKDPSVLKAAAPADRNHLGGNANLLIMANACDLMVVGWGTNARFYPDRVAFIKKMLSEECVPVWSLGLTKHGHPRHPARISYDIEPKAWP